MKKNVLIEATAGSLAAETYESLRSAGFKSKYKNPRSYARANLEKYIPVAVKTLTEMLNRKDIHENLKAEIYEALLERANDPSLAIIDELEKPTPSIKLH